MAISWKEQNPIAYKKMMLSRELTILRRRKAAALIIGKDTKEIQREIDILEKNYNKLKERR